MKGSRRQKLDTRRGLICHERLSVDRYLSIHSAKLTPYLQSQYLRSLLSSGILLKASEVLDKETVNVIKTKVQSNIKTVGSKVQRERQRRKLEDRKKLIDFSHINGYLKAQVTDNLIKEDIKSKASNHQVAVANHILLQTEIVNGKRTEVYSNSHRFGDVRPFTSHITRDWLRDRENGYVKGDRIHNLFVL